MSSNCPPQLQLSIQSGTTNFKRSFEEFGFDLESPVGSGTDVGGGSNANDRNKRARSSSSFSEASDSADGLHGSSMLGSGSDSSSTSNSSVSFVEEPPVISNGVQDGLTTLTATRTSSLDPPPRLPTPLIQDIDMTEVLPGTELVASHQTHHQVEDRYRLSLERFNAFENEISVLRRSQPSPVSERSPTPPPTLPPLSLVSSSSSEVFHHTHTHNWPRSSPSNLPFLHHPPARPGSSLTNIVFSDVGEGSSSTHAETEVSQLETEDQVSDEMPSGSRSRRLPSLQNRSQRNSADEEIEVMNGFRQRLDSALDRLRSPSPLVPGLGDGVGQDEETVEREGVEEDGNRMSSGPAISLPVDPPTLPPIPPISVDEWANHISLLSHTHGLSSNTESSTSRLTVANQMPRDFDIAMDRLRRQQSLMQQRIQHMRQHQQQRMLEMQQSLPSSSRLDVHPDYDTNRNLNLNDHPLPSPILRGLREWMDERPPVGESLASGVITSAPSERMNPLTTASQSTDGNINQEQREQHRPLHMRPISLHSHTSVDSGTWRFVNSLFADQSSQLTLDTDVFNNSSSLSPPAAAQEVSASTNTNSDPPSHSGSVSYSRNLADDAAVRSLDHGIGVGLGFGTSVAVRGGSVNRRHAPPLELSRNLEGRRERPTSSVQSSSSSSNTIDRLRLLSSPHEDFCIWAHDHETLPDFDLDFSSLAGTAGSTASSPSPSSERDFLRDFSGASSSTNSWRPSVSGTHRIPDFSNPTMSSLDFLSPTAAATAPSNLPVNIRHLWGESSRDQRRPPHVGRSGPEIEESPSRATTSAFHSNSASATNGVASPSNPSSQIRLRREPLRRQDVRNFFMNEERQFVRRLTDNAESSSSSSPNSTPSFPNRVPTSSTVPLNQLDTTERNDSPANPLHRPRLRSFHLQTRPGSSTSLVGENAAEVRRREDYAEITRARLRSFMDHSSTQLTAINSPRPTLQERMDARLQSDGSDHVSRRRPIQPSQTAALEGVNAGPTEGIEGIRHRRRFDTFLPNHWSIIHGLDLPDPGAIDDGNSTGGDGVMNRLFGTNEIENTTGNSSSSSSMDTSDATRNNMSDEDVDMSGPAADHTDVEPSWASVDLDPEGEFSRWLSDFSATRSAPRPPVDAEAATQSSNGELYSYLNPSFVSSTSRQSLQHGMPRGGSAEVQSTVYRRRRYSDMVGAELRSGGDGARQPNETGHYSLSESVPALPLPDLGGSFVAVPSDHSISSPYGERINNFTATSPPVATSGSSFGTSTQDRPTRPPFQRFPADGDSRSWSSLLATLAREPTRDGIHQRSQAELLARRQGLFEDLSARNSVLPPQDEHQRINPNLPAESGTRLQEQRLGTQIEELHARNLALLPQNDRPDINPSAYAPGPFRNTLQHRLNEQTLARYLQASRQGPSPPNNSNPPTIPPLSFGDDNLASLSGSIRASPRPSEDVTSSSSQAVREPPRHDRVLPRPSINTFENSSQSRYAMRSFASARTATLLDANHRELMYSRGLRHDDHTSRPSRETLSQTNAPPNRNEELNAAQRRHGVHPSSRHRPHSADARPPPNAPPPIQHTRLPQPPTLRPGAGYGRYLAMSPHLSHTHPPEDAPTRTSHTHAPANRRFPPGMVNDDEPGPRVFNGFARGRRPRPHPHPHPHEMMFSFGRLPGLRRARASYGDFMRDEDFDESYENLLSLAQTLGDVKPKSTPTEIIEKLEKGLYKDWATSESDQRCPICLDDYEQNDTVLKLNNCSHWLHQECLHQWLQTANTCPVCRKSVHGTNTGPRPRAQVHHHHHHHRISPFSGPPSTSFTVRLRPHAPSRRQRSDSTSQSNPVNQVNPNVPASPSSPPSRPSQSSTNPDEESGNTHDDNAPWRRGLLD